MKTKILRNKQTLTLLSYSVYRCLLDVHIMHYKHVAPRPRVLGTQTARIKKGLVCSDWLELKRILKCPKSGKQIRSKVFNSIKLRMYIDIYFISKGPLENWIVSRRIEVGSHSRHPVICRNHFSFFYAILLIIWSKMPLSCWSHVILLANDVIDQTAAGL